MSAADMAARAQIIRTHNYAMDGLRRPAHAISPAPIVASVEGGPRLLAGLGRCEELHVAYNLDGRPSRRRPLGTASVS
jgi:hypothetical protein